MKTPYYAIPFLFLLFWFAGCSSIEDNPNTARLVVQYATLKAIEEAPDPEERRARIIEVANTALLATESGDVVIAAVEVAVRDAINWDSLTPADQFAADALITIVAQEIAQRVGEGVLDPDQVVTVRAVLQWVIAAAG